MRAGVFKKFDVGATSFELRGERGADFGSLWYSLQLLGITLTNLNALSILLFLIGLAAFAIYFFGLEFTPRLATVSFTVVAIFTIASKVYSPQYVLWLTPLAVLAIKNLKQLKVFWFWQGTELAYHLAIWQELASTAGAHFAIPDQLYASAIFIRVFALAYFLYSLVQNREAKSPAELHPQTL